MSSERFKLLSAKYMCKWNPTQVLSLCPNRASGKAEPNTTDCFICICESLLNQEETMWRLITLIGTKEASIADKISTIRGNFEREKLTFVTLASAAKPGCLKEVEEAWCNVVEEHIRREKEKIGIGK